MRDPHASKDLEERKPGELPPKPDSAVPDRRLPEGQLPGMPVSRDPLLNPGPTPALKETPPLD